MLGRLGILGVAAFATLLTACTSRSEPTVVSEPTIVAAEAPAREPLYSPWVVQVQDRAASFEAISFKDVGLMSIDPADRERVHAELARAVASELHADTSMSLSTHVRYDLAMSLPETHLACTGGHIYVDLWDGSNPERFGYSLWSGCSEEGRFAWQEVVNDAGPDRTAAISTLARSIASSIRKAQQTGCFNRHC